MKTKTTLISSLTVAVSFVMEGCKTVERPRYIEDYLGGGSGVLVQHHEIFPSWALKDPQQKAIAIATLIDYLERQPGALQSRYAYVPIADDWMLPRDYWAICLSRLTNVELHIFMYDTGEERERKVRDFLKRCKETLSLNVR